MEAMRLRHPFFAVTLNERSELSLRCSSGNAGLQPAQQIVVVAASISRISRI